MSNWYPTGHKAAASSDITSCAECHGSDYMGGISGVSCRKCHINSTPGSFSCSDCHGNPPSGTSYPNTAGGHANHTFQNITCFACHSNTVGTSNHNNGLADIAIDPAFNAESGIASFVNPTCSKISCHGGQTTPNWLTGPAIDVNTQCASCHAFGTAEYNSYSSGRHNLHVNQQGRACTECHDTTKLAVNHFTTLNSTAMEGPASATILNSVNYNGTTCDPACHGRETW